MENKNSVRLTQRPVAEVSSVENHGRNRYLEALSKKLKEYSEASRQDFLQLGDKIDQIMSQYRAKGGRLREEIYNLKILVGDPTFRAACETVGERP